MVWHYFHDFDDDIYFRRLLIQKDFQTVCDVSLQNLASILRTPDDMIPDIIDGSV